MKNKCIQIISIVITAFTLTTPVNAALIVDTGEPPTASFYPLASGATAAPNATYYWLAAEFNLTNDYFITDIEGWLKSSDQTGNTFSISIYGDGGETPDITNLLYSNQATVVGNNPGSWEGYHINYGNGLALNAGTYWVSFEVRPGDTYAGGMPFSSTAPLLNEAFNNLGSWLEYDALNIGVRISGNLATIPLPSSAWLLGSVLLGYIGISRRDSRT